MTDINKVMNAQHFGCNSADIRNQIQVNPEIEIRILDHFWLKLNDLVEVCTLLA